MKSKGNLNDFIYNSVPRTKVPRSFAGANVQRCNSTKMWFSETSRRWLGAISMIKLNNLDCENKRKGLRLIPLAVRIENLKSITDNNTGSTICYFWFFEPQRAMTAVMIRRYFLPARNLKALFIFVSRNIFCKRTEKRRDKKFRHTRMYNYEREENATRAS